MTLRQLGAFKPAASVATQLLVASLLWSLIGIYLGVRGVLLCGKEPLWAMALAVAVGCIKARLVLDRSARANIGRLLAKGERSCLGGIYSWRMWGLIVLMMVLGRWLRHSGLDGALVGFVYLAVGTALFASSRLLWQQWRVIRQSGEDA